MSSYLTGRRPAEVLLVEDNADDVVLTREGFAAAKLSANLQHVENGKECMAYLRKQGRYANATTPDLILLDLNMPVMDGREVLAELVIDKTLNHLPVVILSTASDQEQVLDLYRMRISSYIRKPIRFDEFLRVVRELGEYWFNTVSLPKQKGR